MSETIDNEIFEISNEKPVKLNKKGKPKKEISPERRAMLLENLKRGRETSAKNRKKNSEAKKIIKKKKKDFIDDTVREQVLLEEAEKQSYSSMKKELEELKETFKKSFDKKEPLIKKEALVKQEVKEIKKQVEVKPEIKDDYFVGKRMSNDDIVKSINKNKKPVKISTFKSMWD